jgi:hypothetical protein
MRAKAVTAKQAATPTPIKRLKAALKPDPNGKRVARDNSILLKLLPVIALPFAGAILLAMHLPTIPEAGAQPVAWLDALFFGVAAFTIAAAFALATHRVLKAWDSSVPNSPNAAVHEFYRMALSGRPSGKRMGMLLSGFEVPAPRVQPVFHWLSAGAIPNLDSAREVVKYWRALVRGNREVVRRIHITSIELEQPVADVEIATVRLHATIVRRVPAAIAASVGCAIAVAPFFAGVERVERFGISFWTAVAAGSALGFAIGWLLRKALRAVAERRDVGVRKILVRQSHNWQFMSGECESQDEADTGWLDPQLLKS